MDNKFIYVFTDDARDKLLSMGFKLLKQSPGKTYIFDSTNVDFSIHDINDISFITSDTLTF